MSTGSISAAGRRRKMRAKMPGRSASGASRVFSIGIGIGAGSGTSCGPISGRFSRWCWNPRSAIRSCLRSARCSRQLRQRSCRETRLRQRAWIISAIVEKKTAEAK